MNNWFSKYYLEIVNIFYLIPGSSNLREITIDLQKYSGELIIEIEELIEKNKISPTKQEILAAVQKFVDRKLRYKKSCSKFRRY